MTDLSCLTDPEGAGVAAFARTHRLAIGQAAGSDPTGGGIAPAGAAWLPPVGDDEGRAERLHRLAGLAPDPVEDGGVGVVVQAATGRLRG